uniref:Uncharacterized protein n=1 Tax=Lepeophtheirus salmonis TaxID=72036 RepID=A0A0K2VFA5_LEPSM
MNVHPKMRLSSKNPRSPRWSSCGP